MQETIKVRFLRNHMMSHGRESRFFIAGEVAEIPCDYWENGTPTTADPRKIGLKDIKPPVAVEVKGEEKLKK